MSEGTKYDNGKPPSYLIAHDVVVSDHNPLQDIQFYAARLRSWWQGQGTLPALQLNNDDYFGVVAILKFGAEKYTERNWEAGIAYSRVFRAAMDHYAKRGSNDAETGLPHRHHFLCCYMFLAAYTGRGMHEFDDRPCVQERQRAAQERALVQNQCDRARYQGYRQGLAEGERLSLTAGNSV